MCVFVCECCFSGNYSLALISCALYEALHVSIFFTTA